MEVTSDKKKIFLVIGMAGSGKTTFSHRLYSSLSSYTKEKYGNDTKLLIDRDTGLNKHIFSINIDPAVQNAKMPLNEDIRDTIDYQETMEKYNLGPNGAIVTCLNLYLLGISEVIDTISEKNPSFVIIDTPGQIEAFTWSSPGFVLVESLKTLKDYEINILYVIDSEMCLKQNVFISNMVMGAGLACRFNCDTKLIFNKSDLVSEKDKLLNWLRDYNIFRGSLDEDEMNSSMLGSLALYFEEFYSHMKSCFISSYTGNGMVEFFELVGIKYDKNLKYVKDMEESTNNNIKCKLEDLKEHDSYLKDHNLIFNSEDENDSSTDDESESENSSSKTQENENSSTKSDDLNNLDEDDRINKTKKIIEKIKNLKMEQNKKLNQ